MTIRRSTRLLAAVLCAASLTAPAPAGAESRRPSASLARIPYSGLGTWIDLYNAGPWKHPARVIDKMAAKGVQTLYVETSSYKFKKAIVHPEALGTMLEDAHDSGMTVVAWYVPAFKPLKRDLKRVLAATRFVSTGGDSFDSFSLDIEATVVQDVNERNRRVGKLARSIRENVGSYYSLGAIVPDPIGSVYWTDVPYRALAKRFDVFLPMCYFTYRVAGGRKVYKFVRAGIRAIHNRTRLPHAAVHAIGGIADAAKPREVRAYVRAVVDGQGTGGSLYDFPITTRREWDALSALRSTRKAPSSRPSNPAASMGHLHLR